MTRGENARMVICASVLLPLDPPVPASSVRCLNGPYPHTLGTQIGHNEAISASAIPCGEPAPAKHRSCIRHRAAVSGLVRMTKDFVAGGLQQIRQRHPRFVGSRFHLRLLETCPSSRYSAPSLVGSYGCNRVRQLCFLSAALLHEF